jgi:hypothetical protein
MKLQNQSIQLSRQSSSNEICQQLLSFCANIYQLLGENFKSDFYKWMLCCDLKSKGFSYQMCGANSRTSLYTDTIRIELPPEESVYLIVRTESQLEDTAQLYQMYPADYLQPQRSVVVNFGSKVFEYMMI